MTLSSVESTVLIQEVCPRDGLQNEAVVLAPEIRADLVNRLVDAGLLRIQIGSFVNPKRVPQMAGTAEVWRLVNKKDDVRYSALVLNDRGLDQAIDAGVPYVEVYVSASEAHSEKNAGMSVKTALDLALGMIQRAKANGLGVTAGVMCAFGCFYEGAISRSAVVELIRALVEERPDEIGLADTAGTADPGVIRRVIEAVREAVTVEALTLHLHDTGGFGPDNLKEALSLGVRRFDSSIGGLGGCPFIPGAKGNISTEDTVRIVASLGFISGVSSDALTDVRKALETALGRNVA